MSVALLASALSTVTAIIGTAFFIDARYAHADGVTRSEADVRRLIYIQSHAMQQQTQILRRSIVEDRVFELDAKRDPKSRNLSTVEEAQYRRYSRQLDELNRSLPATTPETQVLPK